MMTKSCHSFPPLLLLLLAWPCRLLSPAASSSFAVTHLPGFDGPLPFSLETGYLGVDESEGVHFFYYFVQSERDSGRDPLVLWMSGGPGCTSLSGLALEMGPFFFDVEGYQRGRFPTLLYRQETWTKVSNIIYVDSPAGTGFSYATTEEGSRCSDTKAVKQLVIFLKKWLHDHPQFQSNPLYIGGDSYSGIIVPSLTLELDKRIKSREVPRFNLKGYMVGNPVTDDRFDLDNKIPYLRGMGLISEELYESAKQICGGKYYSAPPNAECTNAVQAIDDCTKDINPFQVIEPSCVEVSSPARVLETAAAHGSPTTRLVLESFADGDLLLPFECRLAADVLLPQIWANDDTVRSYLGVRKETIGRWTRCNNSIPYTFNIPSTVDTHARLIAKGYSLLVYNGDHDVVRSFVGTQAWVKSLNLSILDDWRPWYLSRQVAGFTRSYSNNLTYATVKGAGHDAPEYKPKECFAMFSRWISGNPL